MKSPLIVFAVTATALARVAWAETKDFTSPLEFTGGTEITESSDSGWNTEQPLAVSITGTDNVLIGNGKESKPWRKVTLTGDGYLTMTRDSQWSIGFGGSVLKDFSGTLHLKQNKTTQMYFGVGTGDLSMKQTTLVLDPRGGRTTVTLSNNQTTREIGDIQTVDDTGRNVILEDRNNSTWKVGYLNRNSTFDGDMKKESGKTSYLEKVGTGTWTLGGPIMLNGVTVSEGAVVFKGNTVSCPVTVKAGAKIGGTGVLSASVTGEAGAMIIPGETEALQMTEAADLMNFGVETEGLDVTKTYFIAKGTVSCPSLTTAQMQTGWVVLPEDGNVVLKNSTTVISENTQLDAATDWSGTYVSIAAGVSVDLNGHDLKLANFTVADGAGFVNSAAEQAKIILGCNGADKTAVLALALPATIRPVFTGAAITIPQTYVPAGGIGFKDTVGTQLLYPETCANGLAFLGGAVLKEPWKKWNSGSGKTFTVHVEGAGNVFTFDNDNAATELGTFTTTPFTGDGSLDIKVSNSVCSSVKLGNKGTQTGAFAGTITLWAGNRLNERGMSLYDEDVSNTGDGFGRATLALGNELDKDVQFSLCSPNGSSRCYYTYGALTTTGLYADKVRLCRYNTASGGALVTVGSDSVPGGTFAGTLSGVYPKDSSSRPYDIAKVGTNTWTLTGTLANGGSVTVSRGTLDLAGASIGAVTRLVVEDSGALTGTSAIPANVPVSFASGATLTGTLTLKAAPEVAAGAKIVPFFAGVVPSKLTFDYADPSLAGFTLDSDYTPVVPVGTQFVVAEGPEGASIVAPQLGASAEALGWTVSAVGNQVVVTTTKQPPLVVEGKLTLTEDYDYSSAAAIFEDGAIVDLNGHALKLSEVTAKGSVTFTNGVSTTSTVELTSSGAGTAWAFGAGVTFSAGAIPVFTGDAVVIPETFVPAGGIGFKDASDADVRPASCANGLFFFGHAHLVEKDKAWNKDTSPTFAITVKGEDNSFTFNNTNYNTDYRWFIATPFVGDGELAIRVLEGYASLFMSTHNADSANFEGTLAFYNGAGQVDHKYGVSLYEETNGKQSVSFGKATIALGCDLAQPTRFTMRSNKTVSGAVYDFGSLITAGSHPENVLLRSEAQSNGGITVKVGGDGKGGGTFAGVFTNMYGESVRNYNVEKNGTGVWTLTGSVANGGAFKVNAGQVQFRKGIDNVSKLTVKSGAGALLTGSVTGALDLQSGSTLTLEPGNRATVCGAISLSGVSVNVPGTEEQGKHSRELLRATAITGFDATKVTTTLCTNPRKYCFEVVNNADGTQSLRYVPKVGLAIIIS